MNNTHHLARLVRLLSASALLGLAAVLSPVSAQTAITLNPRTGSLPTAMEALP